MFDLRPFSVAFLVLSFGHFDPLKSDPKMPENEETEIENKEVRLNFWSLNYKSCPAFLLTGT